MFSQILAQTLALLNILGLPLYNPINHPLWAWVPGLNNYMLLIKIYLLFEKKKDDFLI